MAHPAPSPVAAPSPVSPGAGRSAVLPRDPGRATEWLYRRHGDTVFRYAWHLLGRREDAEDATQATFLAVHKSLAGGTAVLDSSAWVLRIARNECMGRLRQTARRPSVSLDDGFDPPAAVGVERSAELRDEMRTARKTLGSLPEPEREAFVMREWLGLEAGEAALALGLNAGDVDGLASRARRSLVLAVGGLEPPLGCTGTRAALEAGALDRAAKVHLLRCPVCRGVRRALRPPDATAPRAVVQRLSAAIPGFASGGGGILAVLTAKAASAPILAKTAAIVVAAVAASGAAEQAIVRAHPAHHDRSHGGAAQLARPVPAKPVHHHVAALAAQVTPPRISHAASATSPVRPSVARGAAATPTGRHGSSGPGSDHGGRSFGSDGNGVDNSGPGKAGGESSGGKGPGSDDGAGTSGKHKAGGGSASSGKGKDGGGGADENSGSGKASESDEVAVVESGNAGSGKGNSPAGSSGSGDSGSSSGSGKGPGDTSGSGDSHGGGDDGSPVVTDPAAPATGGSG